MGEKCQLNYFFCCPGFARIFSLGKQKQTRGDRECRDMRKERRSGTPRARLENVKKIASCQPMCHSSITFNQTIP